MGNQSNRALLSDYLLGQQSSSFGRNYVLNPSGFENVNNISVSGSATITRNTTTPLTAISDFSVSLPNDTSSGVTWTLNILDNSLNGQNCMLSFDYTSSSLGSTVQAQVLQGSNISVTVTLNPASTPKNVILNTVCGNLGSATTVVIANTSGNSGSSTLNVANVSYGKATNLSQVSQSQALGTATWITGTNQWEISSTSTSYQTFPANSSISAPSFSPGSALTAPSTKIPAVVIPSAAPGTYMVYATGWLQYVSDHVSYFAITDGTNYGGDNATGNGSDDLPVSSVIGSFTYTTPQTNLTFQIAARTNSAGPASYIGSGGTSSDNFTMTVVYYPSQSQLAVNSNLIFNPQVTVYTSGSGTYTVPQGTAYLTVQMVGGGGGGGGTSGNGGNGTNTTFGTSLLVADYGSGGNAPAGGGGAGGAASLGTGPIGIALTGAAGSASQNVGFASGGNGGNSSLGGGGQGGYYQIGGGGAVANTGGGGGGEGSASNISASGSGGGAGGYIYATISNSSSAWASSYSYSVGGGGTGGTGTYTGGAGGSGVIIVTAYPAANTPILVGSVTSTSAGQYHMESAWVAGNTSGSAVCSSGTCSLVAGTPGISTVTWSSTGVYDVVFAAGAFSAPPVCTISADNSVGTAAWCEEDAVTTSTATSIVCGSFASISATNKAFKIICMGPH